MKEVEMMEEYHINKPPWQSKKWWMAMIAIVVPVLNHTFGLGLDAGEITAIAAPVMAYILAQAYVDAQH